MALEAGLTSVDLQGMAAMLPLFEKALAETKLAYSRIEEQQQTLTVNWTGDAANIYMSTLSSWLEQLREVRDNLQWVTDQFEANLRGYERVKSGTVDAAHQLKRAMAAGLPGF